MDRFNSHRLIINAYFISLFEIKFCYIMLLCTHNEVKKKGVINGSKSGDKRDG